MNVMINQIQINRFEIPREIFFFLIFSFISQKKKLFVINTRICIAGGHFVQKIRTLPPKRKDLRWIKNLFALRFVNTFQPL